MKLFIISKKNIADAVLTPSKYPEVNYWVKNLNDKKYAEMWYLSDLELKFCDATEVFGTVYNFVNRVGDDICFIADKEASEKLHKGRLTYHTVVWLLTNNDVVKPKEKCTVVKHEPCEYVEFKCAEADTQKTGKYLDIKYVSPKTGDTHRYYTDDPGEVFNVLYDCYADMLKDNDTLEHLYNDLYKLILNMK